VIVGIGLAFGVVVAVVAFCGAMLFLAVLSVHSTACAVLVLVILVVTPCTTALAQATMSGLYSAALYRYAAGEPGPGISTQRFWKAPFGHGTDRGELPGPHECPYLGDSDFSCR
jgi:hypothetical protein